MARARKFLTATAIKRIRKMIDYVRRHPAELDQDSFPEAEGNVCSTSFCAAGHIVNAQSHRLFEKLAKAEAEKPYGTNWTNRGMIALGIATKLDSNGFYSRRISSIFGGVGDWPSDFGYMYRQAEQRKTLRAQRAGKVRAFAARWEAFIASDGADMSGSYEYPEGVVKAAIKAARATQ